MRCPAELGHRVYFTTAVDIARKLVRAMHQNRLSREIKNLTRPKLPIIDEVGYLKLELPEASLLFQVISERYERSGAVILTSNKAFSARGEVFAGDAVTASAALDRLLHRSTVRRPSAGVSVLAGVLVHFGPGGRLFQRLFPVSVASNTYF